MTKFKSFTRALTVIGIVSAYGSFPPIAVLGQAPQVASISVVPDSIRLTGRRSILQLVVTGKLSNGRHVDLTREAIIKSVKGNIVSVENGRVSSLQNGKTELTVTVGSRSASVPVTVTDFEKPDPISFKHETLAVITKQGCNAGSCHGSPEGKGGFSLSLFAFDSELDKLSLVRFGFNRRTNVYDPTQSLILKKPLLRVPHVGGKRLRTDDVAYQVLRDWIYEGARDNSADQPQCIGIDIYPGPTRVLHAPHLNQQVRVTARFADGASRDVTRIATYDTSHDDVASITADGLVTGHQRGQTAITVRYLEHLESIYLTFCEEVDGYQWPKNEPENNYVDKRVNDRLRLLQFTPSPLCSDGIFIRRLYLDLTGLLPTAAQTRAFLANKLPGKRGRLIDQILDTNEFSRFQALRMADLMRVNSKVLTDGRARLFADWISEAIHGNMPFDTMVTRMLTSTGDSKKIPEANYFAAIPSVQDVTEATAQLFMGSRIQCAKCHNHPFENWTQDDYYRIGSVFSHLQQDGSVIRTGQTTGMANPRTGQMMQPWGTVKTAKIPRPIAAGADARKAFSEWLTSVSNPYFARVEVNRIWAHLMGRGIVEPVDDFRSSNPPSNVELLDALARNFSDNGFDRKMIFRVICNSRAYQRSTESNEMNERDSELFSRQLVRLMTAEQLTDAIGYITGTIPTIGDISKSVSQARADLRARVTQLEQDQPAWENQLVAHAAGLPFWRGGFWESGQFNAKDPKEAFDAVRPPEMNLIDSTDKLTTLGGDWIHQRDKRPTTGFTYAKTGAAARYIYHNVFANAPCVVKMRVTVDDGMKVWQNGVLVYAVEQVVDDPNVYLKEIDLAKGWNVFLFKPVNKGGAYHFHIQFLTGPNFESEPAYPDISGYHLALLHTDGEKRTPQQRTALRNLQQQTDRRVKELQKKIGGGGLESYATQRSFPEGSVFLKTFGQPERMSPCLCDRSNEPTLDQALQLLNGRHVFDRVQESVSRFRGMDGEQLVNELYLSAFSRYPTEKEFQAATAFMSAADNPDEAVRDLVWAIINTQEFMFQH